MNWDDFLGKWGHRCPRLIGKGEELDRLRGEVPETWLALVKSPDAARVRERWAPASEFLPRFVDYLSRSILDVKIGVRHLECLVIVESPHDLRTCLTRQPGTRRWDDHLVSAEYWGNTMREIQYRCIDDLLADWAFRSWE